MTAATDARQRHAAAIAAVEAHLASCPSCAAGRGCPDGDDVVQAEYRAQAAVDATAHLARPTG
jgi:hypothetical protein